MKPTRKTPENEATSIQVGFVLNTGILTVFVALVLTILSGGFGEDLSTREELQLVADPVEAKMVEADTLAQTSDGFTAFFPPPTSNIEYQGEIDSSGELTLRAPDNTEITRDLDLITGEDLNGGISFSQNTENIIIEYDGDEFDLSVQDASARESG